MNEITITSLECRYMRNCAVFTARFIGIFAIQIAVTAPLLCAVRWTEIRSVVRSMRSMQYQVLLVTRSLVSLNPLEF